MTAVSDDLRVRDMVPADEPQVLALLQASLSGGPTGVRTAEFFRWKHVNNPFGASPAIVAETDGRVIGLRTFLRWRFRSGEELFNAVRAVDTATHPDFQGRGVFRALTTAAFASLGDEVAMVFNTPNSQSLPGYLKMGWTVTGTVPIAIRPVRPVRLARHLGQAARRDPSRPASLPRCGLPTAAGVIADSRDEISSLVHEAQSAGDARLTTDRSLEYLQWRYGDAPDLDYRAVLVRRSGRVVGIGFGRPRWRGLLAEFTLSELIARPGDTGAVRRLLSAAAHAGTDHVATHLSPGTDAARVGWQRGYLTPPGRHGMVLVTRPRRPITPDPGNLSSWRFSLGDLEVF